MNIRKVTDYSAIYTKLDELMGKDLPQMELYLEIGQLVCSRPEKGAAVMVSEYLSENHSDAAGFSPRNVRRMRDFFRTYEGNETLMAETMKIGWTQNVLIMERCADDTERQWYLGAVVRFGWSKLELAARIDDEAHLKMVLTAQDEICCTGDEADDSVVSLKLAAVPSDGFQAPVSKGLYSRLMSSNSGDSPKHLWNNSSIIWSQLWHYSLQNISITVLFLLIPECWKRKLNTESGP